MHLSARSRMFGFLMHEVVSSGLHGRNNFLTHFQGEFMKTLRLLFVLGVISWCVPVTGSLCAADYFVSPSGNDASGDGSIGNPWKTIIPAGITVFVIHSFDPILISRSW